jgi:hypothetical protein
MASTSLDGGDGRRKIMKKRAERVRKSKSGAEEE